MTTAHSAGNVKFTAELMAVGPVSGEGVQDQTWRFSSKSASEVVDITIGIATDPRTTAIMLAAVAVFPPYRSATRAEPANQPTNRDTTVAIDHTQRLAIHEPESQRPATVASASKPQKAK